MESPTTPLCDRAAERSVLGAILLRNDAFDDVRDLGVKAQDFFWRPHQILFEAIRNLSDRKQAIDLVTLTAHLRINGLYDDVGGTETLTALFEDAFSVKNISHYAKIVSERATMRNMSDVCTQVLSDIQAGVTDLESFINESEAKFFAVAGGNQGNSFSILGQLLLGAMEEIETRSTTQGDVIGLATGFTEFDSITSGLQPTQILILAARPGMGKTSWVMSIMQHVAIQGKSVVAFFSLEMSKSEIAFRFLSGAAKIDSKRLRIGRLVDREWQSLAHAADQLSRAKIFIDDAGGITVMEIRARCRRLKQQEKKLDLVVIDYLQLMRGSKRMQKGTPNAEQEIAEISQNLKELAKELQVPIIVLSQLNRGSENPQKSDKRPGLSNLRGSGSIEQDADIVCFIHREDYYNKETEEKGVAELIIAKNRHGEQATVHLAWLGQYTLFANLPADYRKPLPNH